MSKAVKVKQSTVVDVKHTLLLIFNEESDNREWSFREVVEGLNEVENQKCISTYNGLTLTQLSDMSITKGLNEQIIFLLIEIINPVFDSEGKPIVNIMLYDDDENALIDIDEDGNELEEEKQLVKIKSSSIYDLDEMILPEFLDLFDSSMKNGRTYKTTLFISC
jgi:hypothetical protein